MSIEAIEVIDLQILDAIQQYMRSDSLDSVMKNFSYLGEIGFIWIVIAGILALKKSTQRIAVMIIAAMLLGCLIGEFGLKNIICRERPFVAEDFNNLAIFKPDGFSFPSGHSCSSIAAATIIYLWDRQKGILAYILAVAIAFSRLYLYVHYPSDVLAGALLGVICAFITYYVGNKIYRNVKFL